MKLLNIIAAAGKRRRGGGDTTSVTLLWTDNSEIEDGYRIYRSTNGTDFAEIADLAANSTTYEATGLAYNTAYWFRAISYNGLGESDVYETLSIWTKPQAAPSGLAVDSQASVNNLIDVTLSFVAPAVAPANGGYLVRATPTGGGEVIEKTGVSPITLVGLSPVTEYSFAAHSYNSHGVSEDRSESPASTTVVATTIQETTPPLLTSATFTVVDGVPTLTTAFSEQVAVGAGGSGGVSVTGTYGGVKVATLASGDGTNTLVWTLPVEAYRAEETLTLDYVPPGAGLEDLAGNALAAITDAAVTNESSVEFTVFYDDFENFPTGPPVWTGGTAENDAPLAGLRSVAHTSSADVKSPIIAGDCEWVYAMVKFTTAPTSSTRISLQMLNDDGLGGIVTVGQLYCGSGLTMNIEHGGITTGAGSYPPVVVGTIHYLGLRYVPSTGANDGRMELYLSDTPTLPESAQRVITTGAATLPMNRLYLGSAINAGSGAKVWDEVRVSSVKLDNPFNA